MNNGNPLYERKTFHVPSSGTVKNKTMCAEKGRHTWIDSRTGVCRACHEFVGMPEEERVADEDKGQFGRTNGG